MRARTSSARRIAGLRSMLALALLTVAGGCALAFRQPTVRVAEVRVGSMTLRGGSVVARVDVENPNRYALEAEAFRYALSFRALAAADSTWVLLAESAIPGPIRFPARGTGSVDVELPFELGTLGAALGQLLQRGALDYRFTGELRVGTPVGGRRIPIDERGVFRLTP